MQFEMEQSPSELVYDRFPPLSAKYSWLMAQSLEDKEHDTQDQFFSTIHDMLPHYRCRLPELHEKRIQACFYGWLVLSNHPHNNKWSLWNQSTSKIISLPTLILTDGTYESIGQCCLSAPPDDPSSVLLLARTNKSTFVFCRLGSRKKKLRWTEMSYAKQLKRLSFDGKFLHSLTCCNNKVYALSIDGSFTKLVIHVDIVVNDKEVVIKLVLLGGCPDASDPSYHCSGDIIHYLKGSCTELFYFKIYFEKESKKTEKTPANVCLFKLAVTSINSEELGGLKDWDISNLNFDEVVYDDFKEFNKTYEIWDQVDDLQDAIFFLDPDHTHSVSYCCVIDSELGGYIHILGKKGETIYSYHVRDNTISLCCVPSPILPTSHVSMWECRLEDNHGESKCIVDSKVEMEDNDKILLRSGMDNGVTCSESDLLNIPFELLEMIMEHSVGAEYLNFRATCKKCHLAAPIIKWSNKTSLARLKTYSTISPWLMVADKKRDIITFKDPLSGDDYFMKSSQMSIADGKIFCSSFGWLLFESNDLQCLVLFNPLTNDLRKLPESDYSLESLCFSAPPTSADCIVVGFTTLQNLLVHIHLVNQKPAWHILRLGPDPGTICFSIFNGPDIYALCKDGDVIVFNNLGKEDYSWKLVKAGAPKSCCGSLTQNFLTKCDQHLLLVCVSQYGKHVVVSKLNESKGEWEKIDGVGKHMIYICDTTCLCIEAKTPQMENKIFFPQLRAKNRKIVFYSLDTGMYHTFDGENIQEHFRDFFGTTFHLSPHTWIEPSWN